MDSGNHEHLNMFFLVVVFSCCTKHLKTTGNNRLDTIFSVWLNTSKKSLISNQAVNKKGLAFM